MLRFTRHLARWRAAFATTRWFIAAAVVLLVAALLLAIWPKETQVPAAPGDSAQPAPPLLQGPPWTHGRSDARFTITVYADLECPFCQTYVPELVRWIDTHPDVNLQWQHLPLAMHEPAASREARLAECAGETQGHAGFWQAVAWIYSHTQAEGRGVPPTPAIPARHLHCGPAWTARIRWASCSDRRSKPSVTGSEVLRPCGCGRDGPAGPWSSAEPSPRTYCYPRSIFLRRRRHCAEVAGTCEALDCRHQHLFHP